ncbi:uncharacterized protein [Watersipora subatra]|uniref:uncharacterized protein n=1 Tax=Watersipora subatra TaxID=2589382 RepID=UPI00355BDDED
MSIRKETCLGMLVVVLVFCLLTGVHAAYEQSCSAEDYREHVFSTDCQGSFFTSYLQVCHQSGARQRRSPFTSYAAAHRFLRRKRSETYPEQGFWCECCIHACTVGEISQHCDEL